MKFWKLHGIGNDFVAIDGRFDNKDASDYSEYAKAVCHRRFSVGADGLLVVKNSDVCDVEMVYYNSDGSRGEMCGNGLRCFVKFVYDNNIVRKEEFSVNTLDGIKKVKINLKGEEIDTIKVNMGNGSFLCKDIPAISSNKIFIGEKVEVAYTIENQSQYDAEIGELTCTSEDTNWSTYISLTEQNSLNGTTLAKTATSSSDKIEIEMIRSYAGTETADEQEFTFNCSLPVTAKEVQ